MRISRDANGQVQCAALRTRVGSKKFVHQGNSHFGARSVLAIREHGKMARTPLTPFLQQTLPKKRDSLELPR